MIAEFVTSIRIRPQNLDRKIRIATLRGALVSSRSILLLIYLLSLSGMILMVHYGQIQQIHEFLHVYLPLDTQSF